MGTFHSSSGGLCELSGLTNVIQKVRNIELFGRNMGGEQAAIGQLRPSRFGL
jgi:hypothetical protein